MENFTPWSALAGGALLGLSAVILLLFRGRIAGISGILSGLFTPHKGDTSWRVLFLVGMILGAVILLTMGFSIADMPQGSTLLYIVAGLLVGIGTKLGNGCTSGHGICGMGRFSVRSVVATGVFMSVAMLVVLLREQLGWF
ncbi:YeeE/YedE thiosulfate transporter family protein [Motilimonas sp. 1_MG-2023]|uniref:YeeE/YedE family protein n=1 Tax=Motilimonas sp. 1_MG-2023 TaxID=3062672 RepID=UPI0026E38F61|nr:YeeE/YedE thiosulfate transporter family protein [Motilimonas sp. 1_MG-2023]MDO6525048.1 YeeE/YedE thiosulfate transporter family protein [Motilimonas sp. 1_MG-2023]